MRKSLIILLFVGALCFNKAYAAKLNPPAKTKFAATAFGADSVTSESILQFAESLLGIRYRTASSSPKHGFDCSGFVSYVFRNFNFIVPRSSCEFAKVGVKIRLEDALPGDIILFTGTKKHTRKIGHMGIVWSTVGDDFKFIHSSSGKKHGVTISSLDATYKRRFVEVIRLLKPNTSQGAIQQALL